MAPEEILSSVDPSRREFLKKVIAGTTFAVPLMASFSMEGLSVESAMASDLASNQPLCANMPRGSSCCRFAVDIAIRIAALSGETGQELRGFGASPEVIAALLEPLGNAQSDMAEGVRKGKGQCVNGGARDQFRKAARELGNFQALLTELCGADSDLSQLLLQEAGDLLNDINDLVNGNCAPFC